MSTDSRGAVVLQIDGLSHEIFARAMRLHLMPTLKRMLRKRGYVLKRTRAGLPATTPAYHAKALYGNTHTVPGFRWLDRASGRLRTMQSPPDVRAVEARLASVPGALAGGAAYGTFFLAGAKRSAFVASTTELGQLTTTMPPWEFVELLMSSPVALARMVARAGYELVLELYDYARSLVLRRPHLSEFAFVVERIVVNAVMREAVTAAVRLDVHRGVPLIWANLPQYDVMAHHRGPRTLAALWTLRSVDRCIRTIEREVRRTRARSYDLYVLSDHGQVPAIPFDRIHGFDLRAWLVRHVTGAAGSVGELAHTDRGDSAAESLSVIRHLGRALPWPLSRLAAVIERRLMRSIARLGLRDREARAVLEAASIYVASTGGLAGIYLDPSGPPMALDAIESGYPGLVNALLSLDGVSHVAARTGDGGVALLTPTGRAHTTPGETRRRVEGDDPLRHVADEEATLADLSGLLAIPDAGDLLVFGGRLSSPRHRKDHMIFVQQFGAHGGFSPAEQNAFLLGPESCRHKLDAVDVPEDVYGLLRSYTPGAGT
jgi:hypothetical protein